MGLLDSIGDAFTAQLSDFAAPFNGIFGETPELYGPDFTAFIITEIPVDGPSVALKLVGEWMPHQPFSWGGSQHMAKEYYPGNAEPTVQVLGSRESELKISGRFKVKKLNTFDNPTYRKVPAALCDAIDSIRKRGNLVKLTLGEWQRWGFIEQTDWKMKTLADIEYEISFFIIGDSEPSQCKLADAGLSLPLADNLALITSAAGFEALAIPSTSLDLGLIAQISAAIGDVATALKLVTTFVDTALSAAEDVQKLANRAIGLVKYAMTTICSFKQRVGALDAYFGSNPTTLGLPTWDEAKNVLTAKYVLGAQLATSVPPTLSPAQIAAGQKTAASYTPKAASQQQAASGVGGGQSIDELLQKMLVTFTKLAATLPKARYLVKQGDVLETIALKFYGTVDNWQQIYTLNQLTSTVLVPGTILDIPKL